MEFYFTDRKFNIIGMASTTLPGAIALYGDKEIQDVESGVSSLEGYLPLGKKELKLTSSMASKGNFIIFKNEDGEDKYFTIISTEKDRKNEEIYFYAEDAGLDLLNETVAPYEADKAYSLSYYIEKFTYDSGFEVGINEVSHMSRKLSWDGEATAAERILSVATQFDNCEIRYRFEISNMMVVKKYIDIFRKRGEDLDIRLRLGHEVDNIVTTESIENLATALKVEGGKPEGSETNITLQGYKYDDGRFYVDGTTLKDRQSIQLWSRYLSPVESGKNQGHIVKFFTYDTLSQSELCNRAVSELTKLSEPEINFEVDIIDLPENVRIGDRVLVIDEEDDLYISTRILSIEHSRADDTYVATLGEFLIKESQIDPMLQELADKIKQMQEIENTNTWIRFADDEDGNGFSAIPTGKKYIAIKNVINQPIPSDNPEDYVGLWTKFTGDNGSDMFTWVKYADNVSGGGMSDNPDGKLYIGFAFNKEEETPSTNPKEYNWFLAKGADGQSPVIHRAYAWSADGTDRFTDTYPNENLIPDSDTNLVIENATSLGSESKVLGHISNESFEELKGKYVSVSVDIEVVKASLRASGSTRIGTETAVKYTDGTTTWVAAWKELTEGESFSGRITSKVYLPNNKVVSSVNHTTLYIQANGEYLSVGRPKIEVGPVSTIYTPSPAEDQENAYPSYTGTYISYSETPSENPEDYKWERTMGVNGTAGRGIKDTSVTYQAGTSGTTPPTGTWTPSIPPVSANQYLWTKTEILYTDETTSYAYSVGKMGADGKDGVNGTNGKDGVNGTNGVSVVSVIEQYYVSTSATTQTGGSWSNVVPNNANPNRFVWRRNLISYSNGSTGTTNPALVLGMTGSYPIVSSTQPTGIMEGQQWWKTDEDGNVLGYYIFKNNSWQQQIIQQGSLNIVSLNSVEIFSSEITGTDISSSRFINSGTYTPTGTTIKMDYITTIEGNISQRWSLPGTTQNGVTEILPDRLYGVSYLDNEKIRQQAYYSSGYDGFYVMQGNGTDKNIKLASLTPNGLSMQDYNYPGQTVNLKYTDLITTDWQKLTPQNGYTNQNIRVKRRLGMIYLSIWINMEKGNGFGNAATNTVATIPAEFRPEQDFTIVSGNNALNGDGRIRVLSSNGAIRLWYGTHATASYSVEWSYPAKS